MSDENLEVLQRFTGAFNRRDVPVFLSCCDPDIEIEGGRVLIGTPTYRGRGGVEQLFRDMAVAWEELRVERRDVVPAGDRAFVVAGEVSGKGKTTGAPFTARMAAHIKFTRGKVARCEFFTSEREALEAAGLWE